MATPQQPRAPDERVDILLVDDRPDKLLSLQVMLADLNENLVTASSGSEALRKLLHQEFAVILLDVNMPVMDGFETAALIRQRQRSETTPIIFFSAANDAETHVSRGYSLGAVDYIVSPVEPVILRAKVAVFVDLFRKTEQVKRQAEERAEFIREQAARAEAEAAQERLAFLAEASNVLARSLDYQETFENLARLAVPQLADFCLIDVAEETGRVRQAAVAHRDPREETKLRALSEYYPAESTAKHAGTRVVASGDSEVCPELTEDALGAMFADEDAQAFVKTLHPSGYMAVPLRARGRVLGAITLVNTRTVRGCGPNELALAEELAQRAALALENAALYHAAKKARTEAERASLAKDNFLAMLSHELRTPLTPVLSSVLLLEMEEGLSDSMRAGLAMIRRNVELEARLIDDLLDLTRISKGKVQLQLEAVDALAMLQSTLEICQTDIAAKELSVRSELAATRVALHADPARLQQIFWNLIKNAVKFTPKGGELTVRTSNSEDGELCVAVSDSGVGIAPELLSKIFDAFEQGERARAGGLGLGLAITKALVELHKGHIVAESAGVGRGATFTVCFPEAESAPVAGSESAPAPAAERRSFRVLLVEDHEDSNRSLTQLLRRRGYEVRSAFDVQSAVATAGDYDFEVLVSDMGLPDGTGIDVIERLSARRPVFGIALTGFGMESDVQRSNAAGFQHHLIKPVDLNRLDALIQSADLPVAAR